MTAPRQVRFRFDGAPYVAFDGDSVAVALWAAGVRALRRAPGNGGPRGLFCAMGVCQECVVLVDGFPIEACRLPVAEGLGVDRAE